MLKIFKTPEKGKRRKGNSNNQKTEFGFVILITMLLALAFRYLINIIENITKNNFYTNLTTQGKVSCMAVITLVIGVIVFLMWFKISTMPSDKSKDKFEAWAYYKRKLYYFMIFMPTEHFVPMINMKEFDIINKTVTEKEILKSKREVREFFKDEYKVTQLLDGKIRCNCIVPTEIGAVKILSEDKDGMNISIWGTRERYISSDITNYKSLAEIVKEL